jgi:hypothetical protein
MRQHTNSQMLDHMTNETETQTASARICNFNFELGQWEK